MGRQAKGNTDAANFLGVSVGCAPFTWEWNSQAEIKSTLKRTTGTVGCLLPITDYGSRVTPHVGILIEAWSFTAVTRSPRAVRKPNASSAVPSI